MPATVEGTGTQSMVPSALRDPPGSSAEVIGAFPNPQSSKVIHDLTHQAPVTGATPSSVQSELAAALDDSSSKVSGTNDHLVTSSNLAKKVETPDPDKPNQRFIDGCLGDMEEAKRRWRITLQWRKEFGTDEILEKPHKFFDLIKDAYPHWYCCQGRTGQPVYYERSGQVVS